MQIQSGSAGLPRKLPKEWGVLVYNVGETDEGLMSTHNLLDLQQVGSDQNTHVICHNFRSPWLYEKLGIGKEHLGSREYYVQRQAQDSRSLLKGTELGHFASFLRSTPGRINSPELDKGEGKIYEAEHLKQFILRSMAEFPARHYCLVMSGHGCGFAGQGVTAQGRMTNDQLGQALREVAVETGKPLEVVNLNTCYSGSLEVMGALQGGALVGVGSESTVCGANQPLGESLKALQNSLKAGQSVSPQQLGSLFVAQAKHQRLSNIYTPTLSAVDLDRVAELADQVGSLHQEILEKQIDREVLRQALKDSVKIDYASVPRKVEVTDLGSFARRLGEACPQLRSHCQRISQTLKEAVLAEQHQTLAKESPTSRLLRPFLGKPNEDMSGYTGLSIYYEDRPSLAGSRLSQVENTQLGQQWQIRQLMEYIHEGEAEPEIGKMKQISEKIRQFELKANKAVGIPYVVPIARRCLKAALFIGAAAGLRHLGVPVTQALLGPWFAYSGFKSSLKQGEELAKGLLAPGKLSLEQREKMVEHASNATLGLTMGTFGLHMMGILPGSVVWPVIGVATAARLARFVGKCAANHSALSEARAQDSAFAAAQTVSEKLAVALTLPQLAMNS
ncbi:hypothetical protein JST97_29160 [bacterium]|nr:hypothetical protein [bacterium]